MYKIFVEFIVFFFIFSNIFNKFTNFFFNTIINCTEGIVAKDFPKIEKNPVLCSTQYFLIYKKIITQYFHLIQV